MTYCAWVATDIARPEYEGLVVDYGFESAPNDIDQGLMSMRVNERRYARLHVHFQQRHALAAHERLDEENTRVWLALDCANRLAVYLSILDVQHVGLAQTEGKSILCLAATGVPYSALTQKPLWSRQSLLVLCALTHGEDLPTAQVDTVYFTMA
jgi:hypothetical protein